MVIALIVMAQSIINNSVLFGQTDINKYGEKYSQSQYILGDDSPQKISDEELYIYAGYAYMKGEKPTIINFEHPPLGKYLFGLSYFLTGNSLQLNIIVFILTLFLFYNVSKLFIDSLILRLIALVSLALLPIFSHLLPQALLDVPLLAAFLAFIVVISWKTDKLLLKYFFAGISLGVFASIKYPIPFIILPLALLAVISWRLKEFKYAFLSLILLVFTYLVQYGQYFIYNPSLMDFIKFEKYRFSWWTGDRSMPKFLIFETLFTGRHRAWWDPGSYQYTTEWSPVLPVIFIGSLVASIWMRKNIWTISLFAFSIFALLAFALGSAASLRYLLITFPFWILAIFSAIDNKLPFFCGQLNFKSTQDKMEESL